jgi:myb proto-oncogene protein
VLPGRTDNEIKNYWNTHLKKKLTKQHAMGAILALPWCSSVTGNSNIDHHDMISKSKVDQAYGAGASAAYSNKEVPQLIVRGRPSPFADTTSDIWSSSSYAFSVDNISKLLHGFMQNYSDGNDMKLRVNPLSSFDRTSDTGSSFTASVQQPALMRYGNDTKQQQYQEPLCSVEQWLFDEAAELELSDECYSVPMLF